MQNEFEKKVREHNLEKHAQDLLEAARPGIALEPAKDASVKSRLGGRPDVPRDFSWPRGKEEFPLSFVAQISLAEMPTSELPGSGLLSFFYGNRVWGFSPDDKDGFRVYYFEDLDSLVCEQAPPQLEKKKVFGIFPQERKVTEYKACPLQGKQIFMLPDEFTAVQLNEEESDNYYELLESLGGHHRLLGFAEPIQGEMTLECELVTSGLYCGDAPGDQDVARAKELKKTAHHWRLLLQIDSDEQHSDMMWGDLGRLYFWIKEDDMRACNFEHVWLISQCY